MINETEMNKKKILQHNPPEFLDDLQTVRDVMVITGRSNAYLHVQKKELREEAETRTIRYYITDKIFKVKRDVMIVL